MSTQEKSTAIPAEELLRLSALIPGQLLLRVALEWAVITLTVALSVRLDSIAFYLLAIFIIASRQHGLAILGHEFAHYHFSRNHKFLNDSIADFFTAVPLTSTVQAYRVEHFIHHKHTNTDQDPNWVGSLRQKRYQFPLAKGSFYFEVIKHLTLVNFLQFMKYEGNGTYFWQVDGYSKVRFFLFWVVAIVVLTKLHLWMGFLIYWIVPMITVFPVLIYLRYSAEHHALPFNGLRLTRTVRGNWFERIFIAPHAVNFHLEHHLYPSVPCNRLRELHEILCRNPAYLQQAVITEGYLSGTLREFSLHASLLNAVPQQTVEAE